jgi:hypothetical protein
MTKTIDAIRPCAFCGSRPQLKTLGECEDNGVRLSAKLVCCVTVKETIRWERFRNMTQEEIKAELESKLIKNWNTKMGNTTLDKKATGPNVLTEAQALFLAEYMIIVTLGNDGPETPERADKIRRVATDLHKKVNQMLVANFVKAESEADIADWRIRLTEAEHEVEVTKAPKGKTKPSQGIRCMDTLTEKLAIWTSAKNTFQGTQQGGKLDYLSPTYPTPSSSWTTTTNKLA